jgi:hypothetical protein
MANKSKTQLQTDISASTFTVSQQSILTDIVDSYEDIFAQLTTAQRNALTPTAGLIIYNTDNDSYEYWNGSAWFGIGQNLASPMTIKVSFNNTQMMTLGGTRLVVIPAQGVGYSVMVHDIMYQMVYATAAFDFANNLAFNFVSANGYNFSIDTNAINDTATTSGYALKDSTYTNDLVIENEDFELWTNVAATTGGGSLNLWVTYSIIAV